MSWSGLASNQVVSDTNLANACSTGVFIAKTSIPSTGRELTSTAAQSYAYVNTGSAASNELVIKSDLSSATSGVAFNASSGLYPVSGGHNSAAGNLYNFNSYSIYVKGIFNSAGINSGTLTNDNIYFNYPTLPYITTQRIYFSGLSISSFGQNIYTNFCSDGVHAGYFEVPANTYANITIDKFDGFGSGSSFRMAYSTTPLGTYILI